jgi:hypothetical protein
MWALGYSAGMREYFEIHVTFGRGVHAKKRRQRLKARRGGTNPELVAWLKAAQRATAKIADKMDQEILKAYGGSPNWEISRVGSALE